MSVYNNVRRDVLITGDLNIHFDKQMDAHVQKISSIIFEHDMVQVVNCPTQKSGHTLDGFIVRKDSIFTLDKVEDLALSDHCALFGTMKICKPPVNKRLVQSRNIKVIDMNTFSEDIPNYIAMTDMLYEDDVEQLSIYYNENLSSLMNKYAPLQTRCVTDRKSAPWRNETILEAKRLERKCERKWRKSGLTIDREIYVQHRNSTKSLSKRAQKSENCKKISECKTTKQLHTCCDDLLGKSKTSSLPTNIPKTQLPNAFSDYFCKKIQHIRDDLETMHSDEPTYKHYNGSKFLEFEQASEEFVFDLLKKSPSKTCCLDPMPTELVKKCPELVPLITKILKTSLSTCVVPKSYKEAIVKPPLKKSGLDVIELKKLQTYFQLAIYF